MQFEYMYTMSAQDSVEIEDIGNFCISVVNDFYQEWIMICCTTYGITKYIQAVPFRIYLYELDDKVTYTFQRMEYKQNKLCNIIDKFINDPHNIASQVKIISDSDAKNEIKDMVKKVYEQ